MEQDVLIECVPNFSEGRDPVIVGALCRAAGATLLDRTSDPDHHRSVLTLAGTPAIVADAAFATIQTAAEKIDIRKHTGVHPRMGAADVVPFVPVRGIGLEECARLARVLGQRVWDQLRVPVYFYEAAALRSECRRLENIRRGVLSLHTLAPDIGEGRHPTAGACIIGARKFLIAWNINLRTTDLKAASAIARQIRESSGGLSAVKALGFPLPARGQVQVSINLIDFEITPLYVVFSKVKELCRERGIEIAGSELIGMIPTAALQSSAGYDLQWQNLTRERIFLSV